MRARFVIGLAIPLALLSHLTTEAGDLYDWLGLAPVVALVESLGDNGKYTEVRVERVLRGDPIEQDVIRVDVRAANRDRNREVDPRPLRLDQGTSYVLLLEPAGARGGFAIFRLVRGVHGARELPGEGREAFVQALSRCLEVQSGADDLVVWQRMADLLEETNPLVLRMALGQFLKFRRGAPPLLASVRPLLDHPDGEVREAAVRLVGQIAARAGADPLLEPETLVGECVGLARRDPLPAVRAAAAETLDRLGGPESRRVLETIADDDPDQSVRFVAERLLLAHRATPD